MLEKIELARVYRMKSESTDPETPSYETWVFEEPEVGVFRPWREQRKSRESRQKLKSVSFENFMIWSLRSWLLLRVCNFYEVDSIARSK